MELMIIGPGPPAWLSYPELPGAVATQSMQSVIEEEDLIEEVG